MKLQSLKLVNFRRFSELEMDFHSGLTVIAARNGQGKTSILDASTTLFGTFIGAFDLGKTKNIEAKDARYHRLKSRAENEQIFPVVLESTLSNLPHPVVRELTGKKNKTTKKGAAGLTNYGKELMQAVRELEDITLPLMAYYGSGRLWSSHKNIARKAVLSESRTMGYEDCFTSATSFTQVQQWMAKATFAELQQANTAGYEGYGLSEQIKGINLAVDIVIENEGWSNFHYSVQHEELAMSHAEFGIMPVSMLSDGVRAMVSMVADMAWRCAKLNPHLGAAAQQETDGIAFIDEVDMHLHPKWQQNVIQALRKAFPKIQFVVTTHSPQVLSTVKAESIRVVSNELNHESEEWESEAIEPVKESRGVASSNLMAELQLVDPIPDVEEAHWLVQYKQHIIQETHTSDEGVMLKERIMDHFGGQHQEWLECERMMRLQAMKAKLPKRKK